MRYLLLCAALAACSSKPATEAPANQAPPPAASEPEPASSGPVRLIFDPVEGAVDTSVIETLGARLADLKLSDPKVLPLSGGSIAVELAAADSGRIAEVIRAVVTPGVLGLHVVDSDSAVMRRLYGDVSRRATAEITAEIDQWVDHAGKRHSDYYIKGASRAAVAAVFDGVNVAGRTVGLQRETSDGAEHWRSYWLVTPPIMTHESIAGAQAVIDQTTNQPNVMIELQPDAANRFAEATAKNLGKKIAVVLDGEVMTAPIVMAKITGGQISLSMGAAGEDAAIEAAALVRALRSGAVPPLKLRHPD